MAGFCVIAHLYKTNIILSDKLTFGTIEQHAMDARSLSWCEKGVVNASVNVNKNSSDSPLYKPLHPNKDSFAHKPSFVRVMHLVCFNGKYLSVPTISFSNNSSNIFTLLFNCLWGFTVC